jgi:uncharacterized ion transporter superfamily protein YfcC
MENKAGAQISQKAFLQSAAILALLMLAAGMLTLVIPAGSYTRLEQDGRQVIDPASFRYIERPAYPAWRWLTAPLEVLAGPDAVIVITIILFILMVGGAFAVLDASGILRAGIDGLVRRFGERKYTLLLVVSFFFMALGALLGIFEEIVPLVPIMLALSYSLGWDSLTGLGMSILATNLGFSAAISNPFTLGVAQRLAGLPLFSGAWFRILIFIAVYAVFAVFITRYARQVERDPRSSPVYAEDQAARSKYTRAGAAGLPAASPPRRRAVIWFLAFLALILLALLASPFIPLISDLALPLVGLLFLIGGLGAGLLSGSAPRAVWRALGQGLSGIAPGIILILMAVSIKHIVVSGGVLDTILEAAARPFAGASPFLALIAIYLLALLIEFFIGSGSAKAFLMMPVLLPLADLVGVTRQLAVTAYCFGDGFSNLAYPTNPVLLIVLGLTVVSFPKWLRWTLRLWVWIGLVTLAFLGIGTLIGYGPF